MKALIFILLLFLIACEKDTVKNWECTLETIEAYPGQIPVVKKYVGYPIFTDKEADTYEKENSHYGYNIVDNDTIGIIIHTCNCKPL